MDNLVFKAMGTTITLQIEHEFASLVLNQAKNLLLDYEQRFSANNDQSQLMQVNLAAGEKAMPVDSDLFELIQFGKKYSLDNSTTLNIAIGPLIKLWKIGFKDAQLPSEIAIKERLNLINPNNIILDSKNSTVFLSERGMEIDLGALAKGYFADKVKEFLLHMNVNHGIIDLGGNVLLIGNHPQNKDENWRVGIQDPFKTRHNILGILKGKDNSIVTSGIYERTFTYKGEDYHHIFDSNTGYPIKNDIASISIISPTSLQGELYTTMYYQYNSLEALALLESIPNIEAIIVTKEGKILQSSGVRESFIVVTG
ncbi:FAD:protein FMN transferase [Aerococcaceae bacterium WGS1372]